MGLHKLNLSPEERERRSQQAKDILNNPENYAKFHSKESLEKGKKTRERTKNFQRLARYMMEAEINSEDEAYQELVERGFDQADYQSAVFWAQLKKAIYSADTDAARFVRDTAGYRPTEQMQIGNLDDQPFETIDLSKLSNEQLMEMISKRTSDESDDGE